MLVKQDNRVRRLYLFQYLFALGLFLLSLCQVLRVLQLRYDGDAEGHVVGDAPGIIVYRGREMLVDSTTC